MPEELRVPLRYRRPLETFARLEGAEAEALLAACSVADFLSTTELAHRMASAAPTLGDEAPELVSAVFSLIGRGLPFPTAELARRTSPSGDLELSSEEREALADRLTALLDAEAIQRTAKATDVISEQERLFVGARILSDIRPFFEDEADSAPTGAGIVEMLKIDYLDSDGSDVSFYVALDQQDLVELKKVVDRAVTKTETLKRWMEKTDMSYWEYTETRLADTD